MNIGSLKHVTFNPFDPSLQLPTDLEFQVFWSSKSQELSNEILNQNQIPGTCFPDQFFTDDSSKKDLSFLGVHLTSRFSGVKIQVGVFSSSQTLAVIFQYEVIALRVPNNTFRYSYSINSSAVEEKPKTFQYTQSNINTGSTCQAPGIYVYTHQKLVTTISNHNDGKLNNVVNERSMPWTPPRNPFIRYDFLGGVSQRNKPETISIGENSMTVSLIQFLHF